MTGIKPCLWYDHGQARAAAEFYASVFPDTHVDTAYEAPGDYPDGARGDELVVEFTVLGMKVMGLNGGPAFRHSEAVSFMVETETQEETDRYWDAITGNGGAESECGWCKDRWGFSWQITPRVLNELMADPDRAKAQRVMAAMMTMRKIDIATLERAARGEAA